MWGGWYDDSELMREIEAMKKIYDEMTPIQTKNEVAFFADERGYARIFSHSPELRGIADTRTAMGNTGAPYDVYMVEDAESVLNEYKAAVFAMPYPSDAGKRAMELCEKLEIPYLTVDPIKCSLTADEITAFYKESGVHIYTDEGDVVYMGNGFIALHSAKSGKKTLNLTHPLTLIPVFGSDIEAKRCKTLTLDLSENNTALFKIPDDN